jgi:hypothetical protein|tara:strand:+ start:1906 stop:2274 length:369 start_codon:yes stop_codon:yes gene_type:complete
MKLVKTFRKLCTPAMLYFLISIFALVTLLLQNTGNDKRFCMGPYSCETQHLTGIFVFQFIYIIFWTWILDLMCSTGFGLISWFIVLLPFLLFFVLIGIFLMQNNASLMYADEKEYGAPVMMM